MKPIRLFTSLLAVATVALASCSVPRLAQENNNTDDVYNSVAQAQEYVQPAPRQSSQYNDNSTQDNDYGYSDPYYDMDYSSRINRFYYGSPFRSYYDPFYFDSYGYNSFSPWYSSGFSMGFGFGMGNSFFGNSWNRPFYGWGINSPYFGWNPYFGGGLYGGGYYGGGFYGGGYYGGGYGNNLSGTINYGPRPDRGRENNTGYSSRSATGNYIGRGATRSTNGIMSTDRSRAERYNPGRANTTNPDATGRISRPSQSNRPPTRSNTQSRPSYSPPASSNNGGSSQGGGGRSQRGGSRN
ncbi:hypothetical protein AAKU52_001008 [Pedobacter sp. CG_S7]|uniref:hypothetical protein n=1 Tax=Pedobacter sp. CG_S7 TaxID=3143930 RepID=UPI003392A0C5